VIEETRVQLVFQDFQEHQAKKAKLVHTARKVIKENKV